MPKRRKKEIHELADDKIPIPITVSFIEDGINSRFKIRLRPDADEIIDEVKKRGLNDIKDGKFCRTDND